MSNKLKNFSMQNSLINVRDEKEFKLWVKFIVSVDKSGGDTRKPVDLLWRSVQEEIKMAEKGCRSQRRQMAF